MRAKKGTINREYKNASLSLSNLAASQQVLHVGILHLKWSTFHDSSILSLACLKSFSVVNKKKPIIFPSSTLNRHVSLRRQLVACNLHHSKD